MHRVELKVIFVPNKMLGWALVPNAPCGVESCLSFTLASQPALFLMHRVELKVDEYFCCEENVFGFLMHRVELKVVSVRVLFPCPKPFLMHRVELKVCEAKLNTSPTASLFLMHRVELKEGM